MLSKCFFLHNFSGNGDNLKNTISSVGITSTAYPQNTQSYPHRINKSQSQYIA